MAKLHRHLNHDFKKDIQLIRVNAQMNELRENTWDALDCLDDYALGATAAVLTSMFYDWFCGWILQLPVSAFSDRD